MLCACVYVCCIVRVLGFLRCAKKNPDGSATHSAEDQQLLKAKAQQLISVLHRLAKIEVNHFF